MVRVPAHKHMLLSDRFESLAVAADRSPLREPADGHLPGQMPEQSHKALRIGQRHERDPSQCASNVRVVIDAIF